MIGVRNTTKIASISLDIRKNNTVDNDPIILRQGENDVVIEASISNNGYPNIEIGFATFVAKKSDGTIISNDPANVNGNVISYPVSKHLTESVGKIQDAYFMINNQVTTCGFDISIIPSAQLDDTSVNYIPGLENINKFLTDTENDWLGRIQQMKAQIDGLSIPDEFKLLMDKALNDAKAQYQPIIDAAQENVESIAADLAAKKLDLQSNSDELNKTIADIKAQLAPVNSFLDGVQKQIIAANASFTADQQAKVAQSIADLKAKIDALTVAKTGPKGDKGDIGPQGPKGDKGDKGDTGSVDNDGLIKARAFVNLQTQVNNSAVGTNLLTNLPSNWAQEWLTYGTIGNPPTFKSSNFRIRTLQTISVSSNSPYTISISDTLLKFSWLELDSNGNITYPAPWITSVNYTFTTAITTTRLYIVVAYKNEAALNTSNLPKIKLEKGSVATDWCPNPSEILTVPDMSGKTITATDDTGKTVNLKITGIS